LQAIGDTQLYLQGLTINNYGTGYLDTSNIWISNDGVINNEAGATFTLLGDKPHIFANDNSNDTFNNFGTLVQTANFAGMTTTLNNEGTVDDQVDGTFGGSACPIFNNQGLFIKSSGTGTTVLEMDLFNSGTVKVQQGILDVNCGYVQGTGGSISGNVSGPITNPGTYNSGPSTNPPVLSNYTQTATGTLYEQIGGLTAGTQYGQIIVTGNVNLAGSLQVALINGFTPVYGNQFTIIDNQGSNPINGTFANLLEGATVWDTTHTYRFTVSYIGSDVAGDNRDLVLTAQQTATNTAVTASANPSALNQAITFTATITPAVAINLTPTGSVQFQIDNVNFGNPVALTTAGTATSGPTATLAAGTHTVTAIYSGDGSFLASTGNLTQTVYTAQQQNSAIITLVNNLVTAGVLNSGNGSALTTKLNSATASLNATPPNKTAAVNQLNAFINQVNAFLKSGKLTSAQAQSLISAANLAINAIQGTGAKLQDGTASTSTTTDTQPVTDAGQLVTGPVNVYIDNADGTAVPADEQARFDDAITALDTTFGPNGVDLVDVGIANAANAVVQVQIAGASAAGSAADGVLGCTVAGNITLLTGWSWFTGADPTTIGTGQYDFETIVMHELGHAIGLGHSGDTGSVMYAYLAPGQTSRAVTTADLSVLDSPSAALEPLLAAPWRQAPSTGGPEHVVGYDSNSVLQTGHDWNRTPQDDGRDLLFAFAGTVVDGLQVAPGSETRAERGGGVGDPRRTLPVDAVFAGANQAPIFGVRPEGSADDPVFDAENLDDYVPADFSWQES
jgi:hypothetical protein